MENVQWLDYGIAGVFIATLLLILRVAFNWIESVRKDLKESQEARITEGKDYTKDLSNAVQIMGQTADAYTKNTGSDDILRNQKLILDGQDQTNLRLDRIEQRLNALGV